jgi:hypothetical protein
LTQHVRIWTENQILVVSTHETVPGIVTEPIDSLVGLAQKKTLGRTHYYLW